MSRVRTRTLPVQHLLRGGYKLGVHAFQGGQRHHGRFGTPEEEKGGGGGGGKQPSESQSSRRRFGVCSTLTMPGHLAITRAVEEYYGSDRCLVCAAFGLTVSEAKTAIMCLRAKGTPESTTTFSVEAAGQVYNQTNEFVYLGGNVTQNADLAIEVDRRVQNSWCSFRKYTLELYDRPSAPLELKIRMLRAEVLETMLYGCVTWSPRAYHYDTLRRAHQRFLTRCIGWRKHYRADHPIFYLDTLLKTGSDSIEATLRRRRILFVVHLWRAWRIRDCRSA